MYPSSPHGDFRMILFTFALFESTTELRHNCANTSRIQIEIIHIELDYFVCASIENKTIKKKQQLITDEQIQA